MKRVILGAGLTGLSAAYHGGGVIYEKEKSIGGRCASIKVNGYAFDFGIHVLHTKDNYVLGLLTKKLKASLHVQRRRARIYSYKTLTRYPFQANTYGLPPKVVKECLLGSIEAHYKNNIRDGNYRDWIYNTFGKGVAEHFLIPYSEKFWTVSPEEMTADWPDLRVPRPKLEEVLEGALTDQEKGFGPNWRFKYPDGDGIHALPDAFNSEKVKIKLGKEAVQIDVHKKEIIFRDSSRERYDKLISTIPLPELVKIICNPPKNVSGASRRLKYNSVFCVNIGVKNTNLNNTHWIYYPHRDYSFFRISFLKNFSKSMVPSGKSSIMAEVSYSKNKKMDKQKIVNTVLKDLIKAGIVKSRKTIDLVDTRDIKYAYVIYDHDRKKNVSIIKKFLIGNDIHTAGRYGNWEYYWMDDSILDGKKAAESI